jgi:hypothetical protein
MREKGDKFILFARGNPFRPTLRERHTKSRKENCARSGESKSLGNPQKEIWDELA